MKKQTLRKGAAVTCLTIGLVAPTAQLSAQVLSVEESNYNEVLDYYENHGSEYTYIKSKDLVKHLTKSQIKATFGETITERIYDTPNYYVYYTYDMMVQEYGKEKAQDLLSVGNVVIKDDAAADTIDENTTDTTEDATTDTTEEATTEETTSNKEKDTDGDGIVDSEDSYPTYADADWDGVIDGEDKIINWRDKDNNGVNDSEETETTEDNSNSNTTEDNTTSTTEDNSTTTVTDSNDSVIDFNDPADLNEFMYYVQTENNKSGYHTVPSEYREPLMAYAGISASDFGYVDYIVTHESHWRWNVPNHTGSAAYGLGQANPGSKMASAGADWATNPITQMKWMNGYATQRYGSWANAYSFKLLHGWW